MAIDTNHEAVVHLVGIVDSAQAIQQGSPQNSEKIVR